MDCGHEIAWYDNVPILSYALLRGRCRSCGVHIPIRYPAVELVAGLLFAGCFWKFGLTGSAAVAAFFCLTLVTVSATDLEHRIIPNRIVVPAGLIVLAANTALHPSPKWAIAAEEYADYGPLRQFYAGNGQVHQLYGVVNHSTKFLDVEAGVGFGLTGASDKLTLKLILSRDLN